MKITNRLGAGRAVTVPACALVGLILCVLLGGAFGMGGSVLRVCSAVYKRTGLGGIGGLGA